MEGYDIYFNMVLWLFLPHLLRSKNYHFNVRRFTLQCLLWILYQKCNLLCICYYLRLLFLCYLSLWFNTRLLRSALTTLLCSDLIRSLLYGLISIIWSDLSSDKIWSDLIWSGMIWFNLILSNIICSLLFDPLTPICYYPLYSDHSNTTQPSFFLSLTWSSLYNLLPGNSSFNF